MATREHGLFRKVDQPGPDVAKGGCYWDYSTGPGVDTGILIEFEGTLFFSNGAIKELAEVAGFSVNEEGEQLERENAHLTRRVAELEAKLLDAEEQQLAIGVAMARGTEAIQAESAKAQKLAVKK